MKSRGWGGRSQALGPCAGGELGMLGCHLGLGVGAKKREDGGWCGRMEDGVDGRKVWLEGQNQRMKGPAQSHYLRAWERF